MGCKTCGGNAKKIAGNRVKPMATKPANTSARKVSSTRKTTVIRNGKVVSRN